MNFLIEKLENARITLNRMIESDDEDVDSDILGMYPPGYSLGK